MLFSHRDPGVSGTLNVPRLVGIVALAQPFCQGHVPLGRYGLRPEPVVRGGVQEIQGLDQQRELDGPYDLAGHSPQAPDFGPHPTFQQHPQQHTIITPNPPSWKQDLEDKVAHLTSRISQLEAVSRLADQRTIEAENRANQAKIHATQADSRANVLTAELQQCHDWVQRRDEHIRALERQLRDVLPVSATQPDALSERDVVRKAEALNEEIYQLCALVCGTVIISPDGEIDAVLAKSAKKARETIGTRLYGALRSSRQGDNEALLQFALQSAVSRLCEAKVGRWASGSCETTTELRAAYTSMREAGE